MKKLLTLTFGLSLLIACRTPNDKVTYTSPVDSLVTIWENNWNNHDSIAIINMYDPDIVLFDNDIVVKNQEELQTKLIRPYINVLRNMKHEKIHEWITIDRAGVSGLWTVDFIVNDTLIVPHTGAFTYIWEKSESGEWKVANAHIHDF